MFEYKFQTIIKSDANSFGADFALSDPNILRSNSTVMADNTLSG